MGVKSVEEQFPVYDPSALGSVAFPKALVHASSKLDRLLDSPQVPNTPPVLFSPVLASGEEFSRVFPDKNVRVYCARLLVMRCASLVVAIPDAASIPPLPYFQEAFQHLFGGQTMPFDVSILHWEQMVFAQKSITFELCLTAGGLSKGTTLFSLLMSDHNSVGHKSQPASARK